MRVRKWFLFLGIVLIICSCQKSFDEKNHEIIKNIRGKEIKVNNVEEFFAFNSKILVYVDTADCSTCRIRNLIFWQDLIEDYRKIDSALSLICVVNPKPEVEIEVEAILYELGLKNVCLDKGSEFIKMNSFLPVDKRFHVFLLNRENKVELIGSPLNNKKLDRLYRALFQNFCETKLLINI